MIAVIFEVWPADGRRESYLDHAARLRKLTARYRRLNSHTG